MKHLVNYFSDVKEIHRIFSIIHFEEFECLYGGLSGVGSLLLLSIKTNYPPTMIIIIRNTALKGEIL
jgi:hypothetical protein